MRRSVRQKFKCGFIVALASSLFTVGCAGLPYINRPMYTEDLNSFQIDCSKRDQQIQFLLSQLSSKDDRLLSWWTNYWDTFGVILGSPDARLRGDISSGMTNWHIGQNLLHIRHFCG
jgi:hypothetical protein